MTDTTPDRKMASEIIVSAKQQGRRFSFTIDGVEFPWFIAEEGLTVGPIADGEPPSITVRIIADRVVSKHDWTFQN